MLGAALASAVMACERSDDNRTTLDDTATRDAGHVPEATADAGAPASDAGPDAANDASFEFVFRGERAMQTAVFSGCPADVDCNHGAEIPSSSARYFFDVHAPDRLRSYDDYATAGGVDVSAASFYLLSFGTDETYLAGPMWAYPKPPEGTTLGADGLGHRTSFRFVDPAFDAWPSSLDEPRTYSRDEVRRVFDDGAFYEQLPDGCRRYHEHNRCDADGEDDFIVWPWSVVNIVPGLGEETVWTYLSQKPFVVAFETRDQASPGRPGRRGLAWVQLRGTVEDLAGGKRLSATGAELRIWLADGA